MTATLALTGCSAGPLPGGSIATAGSTTSVSHTGGHAVPAHGLVAVPTDCPAPESLSPLLGFTVLKPRIGHKTDALDCTYGGTYQGTTVTSALEITFHTEPATTSASSLKAEIQRVAKGTDATVDVASGYGRAAYTLTDPSGSAGILILNGGVKISVVSGNGLDSVERVAHKVLSN